MDKDNAGLKKVTGLNMPTLRTFIAVEIDPPHKQNLTHLISTLKQSNSDVKWVNETQMHLTLKFLGNIEESKVQKISEALKSIASSTKEFTITLSNIGTFPNAKRPRVIWVGIDKGKNELKLLAGQIKTELEKLNFLSSTSTCSKSSSGEVEKQIWNKPSLGTRKETRDFKAHLTLGRVRSQKNLQNLTKLLTETTFQSQGEIKIDKLILFQSTLTPKGAIYTKLSTANFTSQL